MWISQQSEDGISNTDIYGNKHMVYHVTHNLVSLFLMYSVGLTCSVKYMYVSHVISFIYASLLATQNNNIVVIFFLTSEGSEIRNLTSPGKLNYYLITYITVYLCQFCKFCLMLFKGLRFMTLS